LTSPSKRTRPEVFRRLVAAGAAPGWDLHPVPSRRTPLHQLAGPLHRLSGSNRFYNQVLADLDSPAKRPERTACQLLAAPVRPPTARYRPPAGPRRPGHVAGITEVPDDIGRGRLFMA
jgi:hypothetical protein